MAFVSETKQNVPIAQRIAQGVSGAIESAAQGINWAAQQKLNQAKLDEINQHKDQMAQQMQVMQTQANDQSSNAQAGINFQIYSSSDPKAAAKALYNRYSMHGKITGNLPTEDDFVNKATNISSVIGQQNAQILVDAPANVGDLGKTKEAHAQLYKQASQQLDNARQYLDPNDYKAAQATLAQKDQQYTQHQTALEASTIKFRNGQENKSNDKFNKLVQDFANYGPNKDIVGNLNKDMETKTLLSDPNSDLNSMAAELGKRLIVKATTGGSERITEQMVKNIDPNPSFVNSIMRFINKKGENVSLPADRDSLMKLAQVIDSSNRNLLKSSAQGYSKSFKGVDSNELYNSLESRFQLAPATPVGNQGGNPAPHGQTVVQGGKTYNWNGSDYVESK